MCYTARGAVSLERLAYDDSGDLLYTFTSPWSDGTTGIKLSPLELLEKLAALVPLPCVHLVRYGGCLAPHSTLRGVITPTPRQQGIEEPDSSPPSPYWRWARRLKWSATARMTTRAQRIRQAIEEGSGLKRSLDDWPKDEAEVFDDSNA